MNRIHRILIPTDFSPCAQNAFRYAQALATDDEGFVFTILHVPRRTPDAAEQEAIKQRFATMKASLPPRLQDSSQFIVQEGDLIGTILATQQEHQIGLIVMGTDGADANEQEATSRAAHLVLEADCPVLVVPDEAQAFRMKQIALALDTHKLDDESTLGVVHELARWFGAKVHLLTIRPEPDAVNTQDQETERALEYYLETLDYHHAFASNADIERGITEYLGEHHIDLLAILPHNHAQKMKPSEGRLTELLTFHTKVPLLAID